MSARERKLYTRVTVRTAVYIAQKEGAMNLNTSSKRRKTIGRFRQLSVQDRILQMRHRSCRSGDKGAAGQEAKGTADLEAQELLIRRQKGQQIWRHTSCSSRGTGSSRSGGTRAADHEALGVTLCTWGLLDRAFAALLSTPSTYTI